ncbi:MAG: nuclear transport factor 2 family protein [Balneolaceae bacterium]|nr:nuclear transport factor 2 family protein [Balneolaceae bacterium]
MNNFIKVTTVLLLLSLGIGCQQKLEDYNPSDEKVNAVLDDWHNAAAEADFERYFSHFDSDSAIFMGTDATERWTIAVFRPWSKPYFDRGRAWNFTPVERHVYFSPNGKTAWFDEALDTPNLGPARGSGVLLKREEGWKIAHYNLSIPIPNAIADTVVKQVEEALADTAAAE